MTQKSKNSTGESLRDTLIEISASIIEKEGLSALTLRRAARASGVSHMAPYRHFKDKDALLAAVAGKGFLELANAMQTASQRQADPVERLLQVGVAYVYFAYRCPGLFRLMFSAGIKDRAQFEELSQASEIAFSVCSNAVAECHTDNATLAPETLYFRSLAVWSLVHGLSNLLIDGHVDLPTKSPEQLKTMIRQVLQESRL